MGRLNPTARVMAATRLPSDFNRRIVRRDLDPLAGPLRASELNPLGTCHGLAGDDPFGPDFGLVLGDRRQHVRHQLRSGSWLAMSCERPGPGPGRRTSPVPQTAPWDNPRTLRKSVCNHPSALTGFGSQTSLAGMVYKVRDASIRIYW